MYWFQAYMCNMTYQQDFKWIQELSYSQPVWDVRLVLLSPSE